MAHAVHFLFCIKEQNKLLVSKGKSAVGVHLLLIMMKIRSGEGVKAKVCVIYDG